jgi:hypothetical protein
MRGVDPGMLGATAQLLLAVILGAFLAVATDSTGAAFPRPLVFTLLYATPGVVGLLGARSRRRSLLVAAVLPLIPGSVLSFSLVTLIFVVPAVLMAAGAAGIARSGIRAQSVVMTVGIAALIVGAGWTMLLGITRDTCGSGLGGASSCGTGLISFEGVLVGLVLLGTAVALAAWWSRRGSAGTT